MLLFAALFITTPFLSAQGSGIGGYDLKSSADLSFSYDYSHTGHADHLVFYRPGTGVIYILQNQSGTFSTVFASTVGIGGFDLMSSADRIIPFDYDGSGYADHLLIYRPGTGVVWILSNSDGNFTPVFQSSAGIGGFDLMSTSDCIMPFDYEGSGMAGYLVISRPGTGVVWILSNTMGNFSPVFQSNVGIGGYDFGSTADQMIAFDYYGIGISDHLLIYRPGTGTVYILENNNGSFSPVYQSTSGIGGYDLKSPYDRIIAIDYLGIGVLDHLLAYRPGSGIAWILESSYFSYDAVFNSTAGIGSYDLMSTSDKITTFDYSGKGLMKDLVMYRPGTGVIGVFTDTNMNFTTVYQSY